MAKIIDFETWKRVHRMTPELLAELFSVHASCVHAQENRCPLLVSIKSLCWELNQVMGVANERIAAFAACRRTVYSLRNR
jgi:hypothetical protein